MTYREYKKETFLIVRPDRIGDVILTLPMVTALKSARSDSRVGFLAREYTIPLIEGFEGIDFILSVDEQGISKSKRTLSTEFKHCEIDTIIFAQPVFHVAMAAYMAGIPKRIGIAYRWYSFLFNKKIREHRKYSIKNEAEYNLSLLTLLGIKSSEKLSVHLQLNDDWYQEFNGLQKEYSINANSQLVVLHPGSGGSAREWKPEHFAELSKLFLAKGFVVVVTGGPEETNLVNNVRSMSGKEIIPLAGKLSLRGLAGLIKKAHLFISNSTGPLHIAAAVGTPLIGFYPPIRECSATRWGPLTERKIIFEPDAALCELCHGRRCRFNDCMDQISVEEVYIAALKLIDQK
jgi:heptosyltransferase-2